MISGAMNLVSDEPALPAPTGNVTVGDFESFRAEVEKSLHALHYRGFAEAGRAPVPILKRLADVEAAERAQRDAVQRSRRDIAATGSRTRRVRWMPQAYVRGLHR